MSDRKAVPAFISYAHEGVSHDRRVRELSDRLRRDGVSCEIDQYVESPSGGWPRWMEKRVFDEGQFVLVVASPSYALRWALAERSDVGLGAKFEGKLVRQLLYEQEGHNDRVIPIVFGADAVHHLPPILRDVTRYDPTTDDGYDKLLRRLLGQSSVVVPSVGARAVLLDEQPPEVAAAFFVLQHAAGPLPAGVVSAAVELSVDALQTALSAEAIAPFISWTSDDLVAALYERPVRPVPEHQSDILGRTLDALLAYFERHDPTVATAVQIANVLAFCRFDGVRKETVAGVFEALQTPLKRHGDKQLVWRAARLSVAAAQRDGRHEKDLRHEALTRICGLSWVMQRVGLLDDAEGEARRSLSIGETLAWHRNTAFCKKCLGRLSRLRADVAPSMAERELFFAASEAYLREAIMAFENLKEKNSQEETGECWSLLARTFLVGGRLGEAQDAVRIADSLLVDDTTKAYLDLLILKGDLNAHSDAQVADGFYTTVIGHGTKEDAQRSEILARAHHRRGLVRLALQRRTEARRDFRAAAAIWTALEDPSVSLAEWELIKSQDHVPIEPKRLGSETAAVRVRVVRNHMERMGKLKARAARRTAKVEQAYLDRMIVEAKRQLAIEDTSWVARIRGDEDES